MNAKDDNTTPSGDFDLNRRNLLKATGAGIAALGALSVFNGGLAAAQDMSHGAANFYTSDKVTVEKVAFKTQYQMTVSGNLYVPKSLDPAAACPAVIVGHPMGAGAERQPLRRKDGRRGLCRNVHRSVLLG
ncbi:twin-arginine translocation signal domain-containing protein [Ensifer sp. 22564]|uniref:twin-arginine translocation signal domain-containing protein n=1 Tax=Ensifer sp. 22564 TaxID=3453943 RepID=UPI003F832EA1